MRMKRTYLMLLGLGLYLFLQAGGVAWSQVTERVSVDSDGNEVHGESNFPSISSDGRYVAFASAALDLVAGDNNGYRDIFVHDRQTGETTRVSVDSDGNEGNGESNPGSSSSLSLSSDGMHVAFESFADDLVAVDTNPLSDMFVHNRLTGATTLVSVDSAGVQDPIPSSSSSPSLSSHGKYVAFQSDAVLVADDDNGVWDVFVHDRDADGNGTYDEPGPVGISTVRVSVDSTGAQVDDPSYSPSISSDGRYVAFASDADAPDLVAGDGNGVSDVFVHDRDADGNGTYDEPGPAGISTVRVSVDSAGNEVNGESNSPSISSDGRYVAFTSAATNLVAGDGNGKLDVFVHDRDADGNGTYDEPGPAGISTVRVSVDIDGNEGNGDSYAPSISADGRYVAFASDAPDLVAGDGNGKLDVFVHDRDADGDGIYDEPGSVSTTRVSVNLDDAEGNGDSKNPSISADGSSVAFESIADNLVAGDGNGVFDIFVDDLQVGAGGNEGDGNGNSSSGCFISTAADGSVATGEK